MISWESIKMLANTGHEGETMVIPSIWSQNLFLNLNCVPQVTILKNVEKDKKTDLQCKECVAE